MMPMVIMLICYPILYLISVFIGAALFHLCVMVVKGLENSQFGFEGTLKVLCYGSIGNIAQIVPFVGWLVALVVNLVLAVLGIRTVHRTTTATAIFAILLPIALCCICFLALMFAGFGAAMLGRPGG